ncbi:alkaline phosphatase PafA [Foetidibacter luteolus]|uniref:alkaline phosphatase PafA n=1 Tax=Foetidibacter luteolus TaxID=2608880 RepID=UPI00129A121D|nr:alkaline phosphatase PafA [Foetidibacter luteolus]
MKNCLAFLFSLLFIGANAQTTAKKAAETGITRPKLVVGIVIDQMRWDYLYRYYDVFKPTGGFKRFLNDGFSCENTFIPYTPTYTAAGHACVYTGSVPSIHGIMGNGWYDNIHRAEVYCADDSTVQVVGSGNLAAGAMSPRNMLTTTITDELRIASNFQSKVIGISLKDRGAILPAGHSANAAFWYDTKSGNFISSTYYMNVLPEWMQQFNSKKVVDSLYQLNWTPSLAREVYDQYCTDDDKPYEGKPFGTTTSAMPYDLSKYTGQDYGKIFTTPHGNTLLAEAAKTAVTSEHLGKGSATDFLTVSFSSPDAIGHTFGPNSWEQLDDYARLDETIGKFFDFLDATVGKGQWTVFLTADHAVAHVPGFMKENKLPAGTIDDGGLAKYMNQVLKEKFGRDNIITGIYNYQVYLNHPLINSSDLNEKDITRWIVDYTGKLDAVSISFPLSELMATPMNPMLKERFANSYLPSRSGDIQLVLKPGYMDGGPTGTTHGLWNPYDAHIPLLWYGWGIRKGKTNAETYMTDISATVAALLHIQMPNGCVGQVIEDVFK